MKKKLLLIMPFTLAFVMVFAAFAVGCGGGISRGGGGGERMADEEAWLAAIENSWEQLARYDRNMIWTQETRVEERADRNNHSTVAGSQRTVFNGDLIRQGNTFWEFNEVRGGLRRYWRIERDPRGNYRRHETTWRPRLHNIDIVEEFDFEFFDFSRGRHVFNADRYIESLRAEHAEMAVERGAAWADENPFEPPWGDDDRVVFEVTIRDGLITNLYVHSRLAALGMTTEMRTTIEWDRTENITLPEIDE